MKSYFEFLPEDLIREIVLFIDDYNEIFSLYEYNNIKIIFDTKKFWINLYNLKFPSIFMTILNVNFNISNIAYIISTYIKHVNSYNKTMSVFYQNCKLVNTRIQTYYPKLNRDNITGHDIDLIKKDNNYDNIHDSRVSIEFEGNPIHNFELLLETEIIDNKLYILAYYNTLMNSIENSVLFIDFIGYHIVVYISDTDIINLDISSKEVFLKILFNIYLNLHKELIIVQKPRT